MMRRKSRAFFLAPSSMVHIILRLAHLVFGSEAPSLTTRISIPPSTRSLVEPRRCPRTDCAIRIVRAIGRCLEDLSPIPLLAHGTPHKREVVTTLSGIGGRTHDLTPSEGSVRRTRMEGGVPRNAAGAPIIPKWHAFPVVMCPQSWSAPMAPSHAYRPSSQFAPRRIARLSTRPSTSSCARSGGWRPRPSSSSIDRTRNYPRLRQPRRVPDRRAPGPRGPGLERSTKEILALTD